jgi:N utilization substance protein A
MANPELLRLVDSIHRDKDVDKQIIFEALEAAMLSAARKQWGNRPEVTVQIDRETGDINVFDAGTKLDPLALGRISAQTAKQIIIQRIREAERDVVYQDFERRVGEIVSGVIQRYEGITVIVNLGKTEGYLPKREQVPGENYRPGERIRALVLDVKKVGPKVKITLSRTHPDLIRRLFELEVPEISDHTIEIKSLAREPGARSKIAVYSVDSKVDCVGACVGVRGTRIKNIVDELNGEKIDIVRWSDSMDMFIANALRPAEISTIHMDPDRMRAVVLVPEDQLALGIGKKGQNVRLASKVVGWDIDIYAAREFDNLKEETKKDLARLSGIDERIAAKIVESGIYSLNEFADSPRATLFEFEGITEQNVDALQDAAIAMIRQKRREEEERKALEGAQRAAAAVAAATGPAVEAAAPAGAPEAAVPVAGEPLKEAPAAEAAPVAAEPVPSETKETPAEPPAPAPSVSEAPVVPGPDATPQGQAAEKAPETPSETTAAEPSKADVQAAGTETAAQPQETAPHAPASAGTEAPGEAGEAVEAGGTESAGPQAGQASSSEQSSDSVPPAAQ